MTTAASDDVRRAELVADDEQELMEPSIAPSEVTRGVLDLWGTHNVVYINYDPDNDRYRAWCVSAGNRRVLKRILARRLYEAPSSRYVIGRATEESGENRYTHSDLQGGRPGQCYFAAMWVSLDGIGYTVVTDECWP